MPDGNELAKMAIGDTIFWPAVAQQKPALRKALLAQLEKMPVGDFTIRYGRGGVTLRRI